MKYSENEKFINLFKDVFQELHVFDDPKIFGPEIKLRESKKDGEVDAILFHENIVCLVGINDGQNLGNIEKEISHYYVRLNSS